MTSLHCSYSLIRHLCEQKASQVHAEEENLEQGYDSSLEESALKYTQTDLCHRV